MVKRKIYLEVSVIEPEPSDARIKKEIEEKLRGRTGDCTMFVDKAECIESTFEELKRNMK